MWMGVLCLVGGDEGTDLSDTCGEGEEEEETAAAARGGRGRGGSLGDNVDLGFFGILDRGGGED